MSTTSTASPSTDTARASKREPEFTFHGPWFTNAEGAAYVPCKSVKAFYEWKRRHHIVSRSNGSVAKRDLDRVLNRPRKTRVMSPASLANLRQRHA